MDSGGAKGVCHPGCIPVKALIVGLLACTLAFLGCAGLQETMAMNPGWATTICAGGGALAGAAAGAGLDKEHWVRGAIIGALSGATVAGATCFAIAKFTSTQTKDYQQTRQDTGYAPTHGTVVRVDRFTVEPAAVSPGQKLTLSGEYYVMTPEPEADLPVVESVIVTFYDEKAKQWKEIGRTRHAVTIKPGTRRLEPSQVTTPREPPARQFQIALRVEHHNVASHKSQSISIAAPQVSAPTGAVETSIERPRREVRLARTH